MAKKPMSFRPMLAATCDDMGGLALPGLVSHKLDGIRCIIHPRLGPVTRNLKPIPNLYVRAKLKASWMPAFDGELIVGDPTNPASWNETSSGIMSEEGRPQFYYYVFDLVDCAPVMGFKKRFDELTRIVNKEFRREAPFIRLLAHWPVRNVKTLRDHEATAVRAGYEGLMFRSLDGPYKWGRASRTEGYLFKIKRVKDHEAKIIGFTEKLHNANAATTNALGYTERTSHKANKIPMNTLGALVVTAKFDIPGSLFDTVQFEIGTGYDDALRKRIWNERPKHMGRMVRFKFQKLSPDGKPIFPVFLGFRED